MQQDLRKTEHGADFAGVEAPAQHLIAATASLHELRPRTLKSGDAFGLFDHNGDALDYAGSPHGLYFRDTRHLSRFCLTVDGHRPVLLSSTPRDDNVSLTFDLTNPDVTDSRGALLLDHDLIQIRRVRFLWNGACFERLALRNFDLAPHRFRLEISFAADFADLFEVRGSRRKARGLQHLPEASADCVKLAYTGLDAEIRRTHLRFDPAPQRLTGDQAYFDLELAPRDVTQLFVEIECDPRPLREPAPRAFLMALRSSFRGLREKTARAATIATSNDIFNETIRRCVSDFQMLITDTPQGPYPYAGIPWFSTVFGRDGLIPALETLWLDPGVARGVLCLSRGPSGEGPRRRGRRRAGQDPA